MNMDRATLLVLRNLREGHPQDFAEPGTVHTPGRSQGTPHPTNRA
ncbi:hypothetical protein STBA_29850 [Streptomyces sp. MP131-18]|nr:hypothetical protein [Streptomyces sp. MP131-18]ONK12245.1 hypothetical protein STBA_29850 [Streptomyces sp. MP131-18]